MFDVFSCICSYKKKMFKTNNKNYGFGYVPPLDKPVEDVRYFDLEDVFQKQKVDTFLKKPQKLIHRTEVINFGIIREEIKGTPKEKVEKLRQSAETVLFNDFNNYSTDSEVQSWTLISRHFRNVAEKCFSANVPKVVIFGLLVRTGTINDFSY